MNSQDIAVGAVKGISEVFKNSATNKILEYKNIPIFSMKTTSELSEIFTSTEGMSGVKKLAESETPPSLSIGQGASVTLVADTYGGAIEVTRKMLLEAKDNTLKIREIVNDLSSDLLLANNANFLSVIYGMLNDGFTGATYLTPEATPVSLFHATHTWGSGRTFSNTGTAALSQTAWDAVVKQGGAFVDATGKYMPQTYDTILVKLGSSAATMAKKLFAEKISPTTVGDVNIYAGSVRVIETPGIESDTAWFAMNTKFKSPLYVGITNMPYLDEPIKEKNGSVWTNCFGDFKTGIKNMPFNIYGSTGTV